MGPILTTDSYLKSSAINIKKQLTTFLQVNPPAALTDKQANNADKSGEKKVENVEEVLEPAPQILPQYPESKSPANSETTRKPTDAST